MWFDSIGELLKLYNGADKGTKQKSDFFDGLLRWFTANKVYFLYSKVPWSNLPFFVYVACAHLALLREQAFGWEGVFGQPDGHPDKRQ